MQQQLTLSNLNYNYFKSLHFYTSKLTQGRQLIFKHSLLPQQAIPDMSSASLLHQLRPGTNNGKYLILTVLRIMHLSHCSYILATTNKMYCLQSMVVVVVVMPKGGVQGNQDIRSFGITKKSQIVVYSPFKTVAEDQELLPCLVVTLNNLDPALATNDKRMKRTTEELRQRANNFFKARKYVQALDLYQAALTNLHHLDSRTLSILYSNAAACLFQLRLYHSCLLMSDIAIMHDPTYNKGHYRKIRSLLSLRRFPQITPLMLSISELIAQEEMNLLVQKYTQLMAQDTGVFDWRKLFNGAVPQGQYYSQKINLVQQNGQLKMMAKQSLKPYELILISRPLIYIKQNGNDFKQSFMAFLRQVQRYYIYDQAFQQAIHLLPCNCHPCLPQRQQFYQQFKGQARALPKKQLFNKMQRCIFQQKGLDKPFDDNGYGIWKDMFYFQHKCMPNCSGVHLNSHWMVHSTKEIQAGTFLSIDLMAGLGTKKRKQTLAIKLEYECPCEICNDLQLNQNNFTSIQALYDELQVVQNIKKKKMFIWNIINSYWQQDRLSIYGEDLQQLIQYYVYYIQQQGQWQDFQNLLRLKEETDDEQLNQNIDQVAIRMLSHFLRAKDKEAQLLYNTILEKVLCMVEE